MSSLLKTLPTAIATGFGLGYAPVAPGTVGSLLGCLIVWGLSGLPLWQQIGLCVVMAAACIPICTVAERTLGGTKDDGRIVADEYLTFPICMLGLYDQWQTHVWLMPLCFITCRIMDIAKPFPIYRLQRLPAGLGITIDDVMAALYALAINWTLYSILTARLATP